IDTAVEAMKRGAYDFLSKPVNLDRLELLLKRALENRRMEEENRYLHEQLDNKYGLENIIGQSAAMQEVFDTIRQVAPSRATVLIQGESGTGKELVAQAIHRLSPRVHGPCVAVHCGALSEHLLLSELFGHEKGAFTGADAQRKGRFERADGGTLFLDEIGEIDASAQIKILRVLEERRFERVGGSETIEVDVRLIAATNRNLREMVEQGDFREDLFYRLDVINVQMPPLRKRKSDIGLLIQHFTEKLSEENAKSIEGLTPDALELLMGYSWPGNVRELRNVIERMVVMTRNNRMGVRDIPSFVRETSQGGAGVVRSSGELSLESNEKELIIRAL
ncbi:MAG: sigma-54 dependent transcriptional regulator, partial [Verrucomicrobiota bacterium]